MRHFVPLKVFQEKQSMHTIDQSLQQQRSDFDDISVLALFVDNHDNPRFLNVRNDQVALRNALAYILFAGAQASLSLLFHYCLIGGPTLLLF